ncbi:uroporphyrinogen-III synthase [Lysobacter sp. CA199]|uniref:uroporphyrinogen-III synthase n=1 Tax=Lysobacter sp. CA199 TaxID=3455608 RepID=UPI003F8D1A42
MSREPLRPPRWYVISLRPSDEHEDLRDIVSQYGGALIELSPWSIRTENTSLARAALADALNARQMLVTSPNAVRALRDLYAHDRRQANALPALPAPGQRWLAVGAATAAALREFGIADALWPERMDSEGLLALPQLQHIDGATIGLLTAPGGRGVLAPALQARGARVLRADIYAREPATLSRTEVARLVALDAPAVLALSSGEALQRVFAQLPPQAIERLRGVRVSAASPRLAALARTFGFADVGLADGPGAAQLLAGYGERLGMRGSD